MRKDYTEDMDIGEDMEDIRQVPLEPESRGSRPVGASYMGGAGEDTAPVKRSRAKGSSRAADGSGRKPPRRLASAKEAGRSRTAGEGMAGRSGTAGEGTAGRSGAAGEGTPGRSRSAGEGRIGRSGTAGNHRSAESKERAANVKKGRRSGGQDSDSRKGGPKRGIPILALFLALVLGAGAGLGGGYYMWGWEKPYTVDLKAAEVPDWVKQEFIRKNIFSRPDVSRQRVNNIVIHYVANPGSTAEGNRNYFDSLADQDPQKSGTSTSSHFVVGLEGEVIQCIPITEIAYANAPRNDDTIAIEVCHPDETGKYNEATYESVVNLTAWLCRELKLSAKDVVRHYDINGKLCPKYYVENEEAWKQFRKDVEEAMKTVRNS